MAGLVSGSHTPPHSSSSAATLHSLWLTKQSCASQKPKNCIDSIIPNERMSTLYPSSLAKDQKRTMDQIWWSKAINGNLKVGWFISPEEKCSSQSDQYNMLWQSTLCWIKTDVTTYLCSPTEQPPVAAHWWQKPSTLPFVQICNRDGDDGATIQTLLPIASSYKLATNDSGSILNTQPHAGRW